MRRLIRFILDMDARAWRTVLVSVALFGGASLLFLAAGAVLGFRGEAALVQRWLGLAAQSPFSLLLAVAAFAALAFAGIPQVVMIAAAVVAFGPWLGSLYAWIGTMVSAVIGFWLGRATGGRLLRRTGSEGLDRFVDMIGRNGLLASLVIRLVPSLPFAVINLAAGATPMRFSAFLVGSAIGFVPKILLTALAGRSIAQAGRSGAWISLALLALALVAWFGVGLLARRWIRRREGELPVDGRGSAG
jgi:uncharacterized membrane protein YdjX (TVP38/TMEM64 family)